MGPARRRGIVRGVAALAALTVLAGCSTTVSGTGRPAAAVGTVSGPSSSGSTADPTGSGSAGSGTFSADGDAHDVWKAAVEASTPLDFSVIVNGVISGAGVSGAQIIGQYSTDDDDDPVAGVKIITPEGGALSVTATGGSAWAQADAAVYVEYGYEADASAQASGKVVELTDDDSGLDVYADVTTLFGLCGPDDDSSASLEDGTWKGQDVVVVLDEEYDTKTYVDPATGHILASVYDDETITFGYTETKATAIAPDPSTVVEVDGF